MNTLAKTLRARKTLAHKIRLLRFLRGWNQEVLAETSELHRTYISSIERGKRNISLDNIEKAALGFDVPITDCLTAATKNRL